MNVIEILRGVFGAIPYQPGSFAEDRIIEAGGQSGAVLKYPQMQKNLFGVPMFLPVTFSKFGANRDKTWTLPIAPLVSISGRKHIEETVLTGSSTRGSVKELISTLDYDVNIKGVLMNNESNDLPETDLELLYELYESKGAVGIECRLTTIFNVTEVVIHNIELPEMEGVQHVQVFELRCTSDEDFTMQLMS